MASDDLTERLPDGEKTTQPTIMTVLERIQALDERMQRYEERMERSEDRALRAEELAESRFNHAESRFDHAESRFNHAESRFDHAESRFDHLEHHITSEIASLREEMNRNFRKLDTKIQLLNEDILNMRETQRDALHRIIDLENKAL